MKKREKGSTDPKSRTETFVGRWFPVVKTSEGADEILGFEVKRHMIFCSTYKVNRRIEVSTYRVLGVF